MFTSAATILFCDALVTLAGQPNDGVIDQAVWVAQASPQVGVNAPPIVTSIAQPYYLSQVEQRVFKKALLRSARMVHQAGATA